MSKRHARKPLVGLLLVLDPSREAPVDLDHPAVLVLVLAVGPPALHVRLLEQGLNGSHVRRLGRTQQEIAVAHQLREPTRATPSL